MDEWETIFTGAQTLVPHITDINAGVRLTINFTRRYPHIFDEPKYWHKLVQEDLQPTFAIVGEWAREGLEKLDAGTGWDLAVLEMGDCPEIFRLLRLAFQSAISEDKFVDLITLQRYMEYGQFEDCFRPNVADAKAQMFQYDDAVLSDHNVQELGNTILNWNNEDNEEMDFYNNDGYLGWLMVGSLALVEPLRDAAYCRRVLQGRERLYLLAGFESIFCHLATVTPDGLVYGAAVTKVPAPPLPELPTIDAQQPTLDL